MGFNFDNISVGFEEDTGAGLIYDNLMIAVGATIGTGELLMTLG